mmetsp:Transcript_124636/g.244497  ORF Transcript_124636/g.244497 Transcript_124636/m.244497 type:complete len:240 (-) Transcript_124636:195-914(-)
MAIMEHSFSAVCTTSSACWFWARASARSKLPPVESEASACGDTWRRVRASVSSSTRCLASASLLLRSPKAQCRSRMTSRAKAADAMRRETRRVPRAKASAFDGLGGEAPRPLRGEVDRGDSCRTAPRAHMPPASAISPRSAASSLPGRPPQATPAAPCAPTPPPAPGHPRHPPIEALAAAPPRGQCGLTLMTPRVATQSTQRERKLPGSTHSPQKTGWPQTSKFAVKPTLRSPTVTTTK